MSTPGAQKRKHFELSIAGAAHGGFIVTSQYQSGSGMPREALFAGHLADCLAFIGTELSKPTDTPEFKMLDPQKAYFANL